MKTKMKNFRLFLVLVLAMSAFGMNVKAESQDEEQTVCIGNQPYHVDEGTNPVGTTYNWRVDGNTTGAGWVINNNGSSAITVDWNTAGNYYLTVFTTLNGCNGDTTHVLVHVQPPLSITIAPATTPTSICAGMQITFTATAVNAGPSATYQWFENGSPVSGATSLTYTYTGVAPGATITCEVTSPDACATGGSHTAVSNSVVVEVTAQVTLTVSIAADNDSICINGVINFTATAEPSGATVTYKWFNGGIEIIGATASTYQYTGTVAGSYNITCQVSSTDPCIVNSPATSNEITIVVKPKPVTSGIWHN